MGDSIADQIEKYLKQLLAESSGEAVELSRQSLAQLFTCVPSQINYVLATRFTHNHGYIVETRRGGGGFIKISKMELCPKQHTSLITDIGPGICQQGAWAYISRFLEEDLINQREAQMLRAVLHRKNLLIELPERDQLRAQLLKAIVTEIFSSAGDKKEEGEQ